MVPKNSRVAVLRSVEKNFLLKILDSGFVQRVRDSMSTIEECFDRYEPNQVIVAFNGGKDCIVILHLAYAYLKVHYGT